MAWTTPPTFVATNPLTAAQLNTYLRDNTNYLFSNVVNPPGAKSHKTANQGIATATWSGSALDTSDYDTDTLHNVATGTFTFNTQGTYICVGTCQFANSNVGLRGIRLNKNSGTLISSNFDGAPSSTLNCNLAVTGIQQFNSTDTLQCEVYQNSGGSLNLIGTAPPLGYSLAVAWLGDY
jgi:hypothetical protein